MEDPDVSSKTAKYRTAYLNSDGILVNCTQGDKLFLQTRLFRAVEPGPQNIPVFVKSIIKQVTGNTVTIPEVEIVGEFRDADKQLIVKNTDQSKFQSQFRQKPIKLTKDGRWAIVPAGTSSGLSRTQYQEDFPKSIGLPETSTGEEIEPISTPETSDPETLAALLKQVSPVRGF